MDDELVHVDEPALDERGGEGGTADLEITVELRPELFEHLADVPRHEARVPLDPVERRGEHDLRLGVPDPGEVEHRLGCRRVGLGRRASRRS